MDEKDFLKQLDRINKKVNDIYNLLVDKITKGINKREQEFYSREAQIDRKLRVLGERAGIDISKAE